MDNFEIKDILDTFSVIVDSREQGTPKSQKRYKAFGVPYTRATLDYGDYCGNILLPSGSLHDTQTRIKAPCVVERKMSLDEVAGNLGINRDRFQREFERARDAGARVYLLIENGSYEAILGHRYRSRMHPNALLGSLVAWSVRYNASIVFCKAETSGRVIKEILYRDIKERLERGEYG